MKIIFEHNDGYTFESADLATYDEVMKTIQSEAASTSEYAEPEDVQNVFPIRWDIEGCVPSCQKSYGYITNTGDIL